MAMAFLLLGLGFLLGILSLAIAEGLALLWAIRSLTRRSSASRATPPPPQLPVHPTPPRSVSRHGLNRQVRPGREGHPFIFSIGSVQFRSVNVKQSKQARTPQPSSACSFNSHQGLLYVFFYLAFYLHLEGLATHKLILVSILFHPSIVLLRHMLHMFTTCTLIIN
jgi:hypothetical protein